VGIILVTSARGVNCIMYGQTTAGGASTAKMNFEKRPILSEYEGRRPFFGEGGRGQSQRGTCA